MTHNAVSVYTLHMLVEIGSIPVSTSALVFQEQANTELLMKFVMSKMNENQRAFINENNVYVQVREDPAAIGHRAYFFLDDRNTNITIGMMLF